LKLIQNLMDEGAQNHGKIGYDFECFWSYWFDKTRGPICQNCGPILDNVQLFVLCTMGKSGAVLSGSGHCIRLYSSCFVCGLERKTWKYK